MAENLKKRQISVYLDWDTVAALDEMARERVQTHSQLVEFMTWCAKTEGLPAKLVRRSTPRHDPEPEPETANVAD